jgi:hypothetical protein
MAMVRTASGHLPVLSPEAFLSRRLLRELPGVLARLDLRESAVGAAEVP